jgi:hypothetical protein
VQLSRVQRASRVGPAHVDSQAQTSGRATTHRPGHRTTDCTTRMRKWRLGLWQNQGEVSQTRPRLEPRDDCQHLEQYSIPPVPERHSPSWRHLMTHYRNQLLACDFFTVETLFLQTVCVLFSIETGSAKGRFPFFRFSGISPIWYQTPDSLQKAWNSSTVGAAVGQP